MLIVYQPFLVDDPESLLLTSPNQGSANVRLKAVVFLAICKGHWAPGQEVDGDHLSMAINQAVDGIPGRVHRMFIYVNLALSLASRKVEKTSQPKWIQTLVG